MLRPPALRRCRGSYAAFSPRLHNEPCTQGLPDARSSTQRLIPSHIPQLATRNMLHSARCALPLPTRPLLLGPLNKRKARRPQVPHGATRATAKAMKSDEQYRSARTGVNTHPHKSIAWCRRRMRAELCGATSRSWLSFGVTQQLRSYSQTTATFLINLVRASARLPAARNIVTKRTDYEARRKGYNLLRANLWHSLLALYASRDSVASETHSATLQKPKQGPNQTRAQKYLARQGMLTEKGSDNGQRMAQSQAQECVFV